MHRLSPVLRPFVPRPSLLSHQTTIHLLSSSGYWVPSKIKLDLSGFHRAWHMAHRYAQRYRFAPGFSTGYILQQD